MKAPTLHRLSPLLCLAFCGLLVLACQGKPKEASASVSASPATPVVRTILVSFVQGEVKIDGKSVEAGAELSQKIRVETGVGARCDLVFDGANVVSVGPKALVLLDFSSPAITVKLEQGGLSSVLKKLAKLADRPSFDIRTREAILSVRGTSFFVEAEAASTYLCACNGAVHATDLSGGNPLDLVSAHHVARVLGVKEGRLGVTEGTLLYHDDASMESVAARIGYHIDWTKPD